MYQDKVMLTIKDILEKDFKFDTRGYRPQEVDKFLDTIIRDYEGFYDIINSLEQERKEIIEDNIHLKQEIRALKSKLELLKNNGMINDTGSNADLLRRISNLEKFVYNKD